MDRNAEVQEKRRRVRAWLEREGLDGVLLSKQAHFAWYTAGGENRVVLAGEAGAASLYMSPPTGVEQPSGSSEARYARLVFVSQPAQADPPCPVLELRAAVAVVPLTRAVFAHSFSSRTLAGAD